MGSLDSGHSKKPLLIKRRWYGTDREQGTIELLSLARPIVKNGRVMGAVLINLDYDRFFQTIYSFIQLAIRV